MIDSGIKLKQNEIRITKLTDLENFQGLRDQWNDLLISSQSDTIFLTFEWIDAWISNFLRKDELYILTAFEDSELLGIAPLYRCHLKFLKIANIRMLRFLGDREAGSEYLDFLIKDGHEEAVRGAFFNFLRQNVIDFDLIWLKELPPTSVNLDPIKGWATNQKWSCHVEQNPCSGMTLPGTWDEYLKSLDGKHRYSVRSKRKKLDKDYQYHFKEVNLSGPEKDNFLSSLFEMHQRKWVEIGFPGSFSKISKRTFYRDIAKHFSKTNWMKFYYLEIDNQIKACHFSFLYNNQVLSLQEAFDPSWKKQGVGNVLRGLVIEKIIGEGVDSYDFLGGTSSHKRNWGASESLSTDVIIFDSGNFKSKIFFFYNRQLKKWVKSILPDSILNYIQKRSEQKRKEQVNKKAEAYLNIEPLYHDDMD